MAEKAKQDLFDLDAISKDSIVEMPDPFFSDDPEAIREGEKYVVFQIEDEQYALPSDKVVEVVRMLPVTVIPNLPDWILGIANLRGDIVSVVDLAGFWNGITEEASPKSKLVVLDTANSKTNIAFRVDRLREIVVLESGQIEAVDDPEKKHLVGVAKHKSISINVLDETEIISSLTIR